MRLRDVARAFNKTACYDAYTGDLAFHAQLGLYDDTKRDSETAERRVLSVDPDVVVPDRRVIEFDGIKFIVGHGNLDTYRGSPLRMGYVVHEASDLATVQTLAQFCTNTPGVSAWAARTWVKNLGYSEQDSKLITFHHVHLASTEVADVSYILTLGATRYIVRTTDRGAAGTLILFCDEMPEPSVETGSVVHGSYNPTTDAMTTTTASTRVVRVRWQSLFDYQTTKADKFGPGDQQLVVAQAAVPAPVGAKVTLSDGVWHILSADPYGAVWLCHAVRHG